MADRARLLVVNWWSGTAHAGIRGACDRGDKSFVCDDTHVSVACGTRVGANAGAYTVCEALPANARVPVFGKKMVAGRENTHTHTGADDVRVWVGDNFL